MKIGEFLALPHRFRWGGMGGDDCMTFAASWVKASMGIDPAADLRGSYSSKVGAHAILASNGGPLQFMAGKLEPLGFIRTDDPESGDIGLVQVIGEATEALSVGSIRFGTLWAAISPRGPIACRANVMVAWRMPR